jgi:hypothetical protein
MPNANPCDATTLRVEGPTAIFVKLLAGAIILAPLVMMLVPELSRYRENNVSRGNHISPAVQAKTANSALVPFSAKRCD